MKMPSIAQSFVASDGASIAYEESGGGQSIVFVHGFTLDRSVWARQAEHLPAGYRLVMYDLRGHGASSNLPADYSKKRLLLDLEELVRRIGGEHIGGGAPIFCGHSLGCSIAVEYALKHPDGVTALILVSPYVSGCPRRAASIWNSLATPFDVIARAQGIAEAKKRWENFPLFDRARQDPRTARQLHLMIAAFSGTPWLSANLEETQGRSPYDRLPELGCPVLAVCGAEDDVLYSAVAGHLKAVVEPSTLVVIPRAGHLCPIEQPEHLADTISLFLQRLKRQARTGDTPGDTRTES